MGSKGISLQVILKLVPAVLVQRRIKRMPTGFDVQLSGLPPETGRGGTTHRGLVEGQMLVPVVKFAVAPDFRPLTVLTDHPQFASFTAG